MDKSARRVHRPGDRDAQHGDADGEEHQHGGPQPAMGDLRGGPGRRTDRWDEEAGEDPARPREH